MSNQLAGLSQVLAEQRITEWRQQAAHARLVAGARRRAAGTGGGRPVVGGGWPGGRRHSGAAGPPPRKAAVDRSETTMSKRTRALVVGATLAAMNLAGMTAVAQAHVTEYTIKPYASPPLDPHAGESYRNRQVAPQQQTAADAAPRRVLAQEHSSSPRATPAQATAPVPAEPSWQPSWLLASLGELAAALALIAGLAVLAARRARRRARVGHAA